MPHFRIHSVIRQLTRITNPNRFTKFQYHIICLMLYKYWTYSGFGYNYIFASRRALQPEITSSYILRVCDPRLFIIHLNCRGLSSVVFLRRACTVTIGWNLDRAFFHFYIKIVDDLTAPSNSKLVPETFWFCLFIRESDRMGVVDRLLMFWCFDENDDCDTAIIVSILRINNITICTKFQVYVSSFMVCACTEIVADGAFVSQHHFTWLIPVVGPTKTCVALVTIQEKETIVDDS